MYTVSQLSAISGVSIRSIQHYHRIGLFEPTVIGENGYRYYDEDKIFELQQILFFKELNFPLREIGKILKDPAFSIETSLKKQRELLLLKIDRLNGVVDLIEKTMENRKGENIMNDRDYFSEINEEKVRAYTERAKKEYGETLVNESIINVKKEFNNDYTQMQQVFEDWLREVKDVMSKGPESVEVQSLINDWYKHINRLFTCDIQTFSGLGFLYRDNEEFAVAFRKVDEEMPEFICKAIQSFCSEV